MGRKKQSEENLTEILASKKYTKSNALINSKGKASLLAEKLFAIGIQQAVEDEKTGILTTTMRGTELKKIFGTKRGSFYDDIKDLVDPPSKSEPSLLDWRIIYTDDTTQTVEAINIIMDASFEKGVFKVRFNNKVNKQVRKLQSNYTVFSLAETIPLKSIYSFKLYEILKAEYDRQDYVEKKRGTWKPNATYITEMHIIDLKLRLGVIDTSWSKELTEELKQAEPDYDIIEKMADELSKKQTDKVSKTYNSYKRIDNFKKNVLERARTELDEKTSISFRYENLSGGAGGKVYGFRFFVTQKSNSPEPEIVDVPVNNDLSDDDKLEIIFEVKQLLSDGDFTMKEIRTITEKANYNVDVVRNAYAIMNQSVSPINNPTAWMIKAIEDGYEAPKPRTATKVNNFQQQTYDFDKLEEQLLEN